MAFEEGNVKKSGSSPEGCIRFHSVSYGRWRGDTALYGRWRGYGSMRFHTGRWRGDTAIYGRCAGWSFITGPLRGEGDLYEEIHVG